MRRVTAVAFVTLAVLGAGCGGGGESSSTPTTQFAEASRTVGDVEVKVRPTALDASGAQFTVTFDTHNGELDADLTAATLDVDGARWPAATWDGDPPGGHHRTGTLRFSEAGPTSGTATLTIVGLAEPAVFTWTAGGA